MNKKEKELRSLFRERAEYKPKKYGNWAILRLNSVNGFLCMDTWNGAFHHKIGTGEYEYWTGFSGKSVYYFGLNDSWAGSEKQEYSDSMYQYFIDIIKEEDNDI